MLGGMEEAFMIPRLILWLSLFSFFFYPSLVYHKVPKLNGLCAVLIVSVRTSLYSIPT